jgi:hypothetical protein
MTSKENKDYLMTYLRWLLQSFPESGAYKIRKKYAD